MKKDINTMLWIVIIGIVAIGLLYSCSPSKIWQQEGKMRLTSEGRYVFEPYGKWHEFNPSKKPFPDTVYKFINAVNPPKY